MGYLPSVEAASLPSVREETLHMMFNIQRGGPGKGGRMWGRKEEVMWGSVSLASISKRRTAAAAAQSESCLDCLTVLITQDDIKVWTRYWLAHYNNDVSFLLIMTCLFFFLFFPLRVWQDISFGYLRSGLDLFFLFFTEWYYVPFYEYIEYNLSAWG